VRCGGAVERMRVVLEINSTLVVSAPAGSSIGNSRTMLPRLHTVRVHSDNPAKRHNLTRTWRHRMPSRCQARDNEGGTDGTICVATMSQSASKSIVLSSIRMLLYSHCTSICTMYVIS
jgi:hypothetical protein